VNEINNQTPLSHKKSYQQPSLRVYGDIRVLTQTLSTPGASIDSSPGMKTK